MRDQGLKAEIENGRLVLSIGVDTLCHAVSIGRRYGTGEVTVSDNDTFAREVLGALTQEDETGATVVHEMLDQATATAIEDGAQGASFDEE